MTDIVDYSRTIQTALKYNDIVIAFDDECFEIREIHKSFLESAILKNSNKKILILEFEGNEQDLFLKIYRLYEFSNRVCYVSDNTQYGTLLNYLKTGVINRDELFESLIY